VVHMPAFISKKCRNSPVAISSVFAGKRNDGAGQCFLIIGNTLLISLAGSRLSDDLACPTFRHMEDILDMIYTFAATFRA